MSGIRGRTRSLCTLGRVLIEPRCTRRVLVEEELHRHVPFVPTRSIFSFRSFLGERIPVQRGGVQSRTSGNLIESKTFPQGVRLFNRPFHSSWSSEIADSGKSGEAVSEISGDNPKTAGENPKAVRGGPVSWASLALLVVTGIGLILLWEKEKQRQLEVLRSEKSTVAKTGPGVGKAAIGGPFQLVNQDGKVVTDRDFVGNWSLVYFGFTYCPDVCPEELTKVAEAVDKIETKVGLQVVPVFISVDPERDTVDQVREYLKEYHPRFVGLTGTVDDVRQVARKYRVYYMKTEDEGTDYLVDHSIITYLMDPDMNFVKFFGKSYDAESLSEGIISEIQSTQKKK